MGWAWSWPVTRNQVFVHQGPMQFGFCMLDKKGRMRVPIEVTAVNGMFKYSSLKTQSLLEFRVGKALGQQGNVYDVGKASTYSSMSEYTAIGRVGRMACFVLAFRCHLYSWLCSYSVINLCVCFFSNLCKPQETEKMALKQLQPKSDVKSDLCCPKAF